MTISLTRGGRIACATAVAATLIGAGLAGPAAAANLRTTTDRTAAAAGWLTTQLEGPDHLPAPNGDHVDGSYGSVKNPTYYVNYGVNADIIFGLAAAGSGKSTITTALNYLRTNAAGYGDFSNSDGYGPNDGGIGKMALAAIVAGSDPTSFGGYNLLQHLKQDECPQSSTGCTPGSQQAGVYSVTAEAFVILAEARAGGAYAPSAAAVQYLTSLQCSGGGFPSSNTACTTDSSADVDSTAYALMALQAVGGQSAAVTNATDWLSAAQHSGGYWADSTGEANVNSTGVAAAALAGVGHGSASARTWLLAQQVPAGKIGAGALAYGGSFVPTTKTTASTSLLATAQGLTGIAANGSLASVSASGASNTAALFAPHASSSAAAVAVGAKATVNGVGFAAGEKVDVSLHSTPVAVGSAVAGPGGTATLTFAMPALSTGAHTIELTGVSSGLTATVPVTVRAATTTVSSSASASSSTQASTLANTGQNGAELSLLGGVGALAVLAGLTLVIVGRRRGAAHR